MSFRRGLWLGLFLCALPYFYCFIAGRTFAPMDALYSTTLPYAADHQFHAPDNHFWSDTVSFYWPRYHTIARHEFPISFSSGGGGPNYADTISGFFSPYCLLVFTLLPMNAHSLDFLWLLQFLVFYGGLYLWFTAIGATTTGALLGALSQCFCTAYFAGSYSAFQTLGAMSFLPWALWAEARFDEKSHGKYAPAIFITLGIFSGNIQTALYPMMVFGLWGLLRRKPVETFYTLTMAVLLSLPLWLPGIQYHILLGLQNIANRRSQVPVDFPGRIKALMALPSILLPALYGSSKSIDFLKVFHTSATYFLGSIGLLSPTLCFLSWKKENWNRITAQFAILLLAGAIFVMITPLLNFLYYRVVCLVCFAFSILLAMQFEQFFEIKRKRFLLFLPAALLALSALAFLAKKTFHEQLRNMFLTKLAASTYSWSAPLREARVDRWFQDYLSNPAYFVLLVSLVFCYWALQRRKQFLLAAVLLFDIGLVWYSQVTFNRASYPTNSAFNLIKSELQRSSSYPASRFFALDCDDPGEFLFPFSLHEYQGVPSIQYYGSTMIRRLPEPNFHCDPATHFISFLSGENLQKDALNVLVTRKVWTLVHPEYHLLFENEKFRIWSRSPFSAIWSADGVDRIEAKTVSWNGWEIIWRLHASMPVDNWSISLPYYPGWHYWLDGREIKSSRVVDTVPSFSEKVAAGEHTVVAFFHPVMLYMGLLASVLTVLFMLWKSTLIRD